MPDNVQLHRGLFDRTLPGWLHDNIGPVTFLHIDCDLYSSTQSIFKALADRIVPGTIIVFDEYFNYPNWDYSTNFWPFRIRGRARSRLYLILPSLDSRLQFELIRPEPARMHNRARPTER